MFTDTPGPGFDLGKFSRDGLAIAHAIKEELSDWTVVYHDYHLQHSGGAKKGFYEYEVACVPKPTVPAAAGLPLTLDVDEDNYPSEERLDEISAAIGLEGLDTWMIGTFPVLASSIGYGGCEVTDADDRGGPAKRIVYHTQGWSGCEDFIGAVCRNTLIRALYYVAWQTGGRHTFLVPSEPIPGTWATGTREPRRRLSRPLEQPRTSG